MVCRCARRSDRGASVIIRQYDTVCDFFSFIIFVSDVTHQFECFFFSHIIIIYTTYTNTHLPQIGRVYPEFPRNACTLRETTWFGFLFLIFTQYRNPLCIFCGRVDENLSWKNVFLFFRFFFTCVGKRYPGDFFYCMNDYNNHFFLSFATRKTV